MYKVIINILLLFVLGATALPVKQVGKLLYSNQLQEETNDDDDDSSQEVTVTAKFMVKEMVYLHDGHAISFTMPVATALPTFFQFGHGPLLCPPVDIHCPPPNLG